MRKQCLIASYALVGTFSLMWIACSPPQCEHDGPWTVASIADGDTIYVRDQYDRRRHIRIQAIDTPEFGAPLAQEATEALTKMLGQRPLTLRCAAADAYQREVCVVIADGRDAGLELVRQGLATYERQFKHEQIPKDRELYDAAEIEARNAQRGIWALPQLPVTPAPMLR